MKRSMSRVGRGKCIRTKVSFCHCSLSTFFLLERQVSHFTVPVEPKGLFPEVVPLELPVL